MRECKLSFPVELNGRCHNLRVRTDRKENSLERDLRILAETDDVEVAVDARSESPSSSPVRIHGEHEVQVIRGAIREVGSNHLERRLGSVYLFLEEVEVI